MNQLSIQKLYRSLYKSVSKCIPDKLDESRSSDFEIWNDGTVLVDESGEPIVFYHSYDSDYGDNLEASSIYLSASEEFSQEFGDVTDRYYVKMKRPYYAQDDIIRDADGNPFMINDCFSDECPEELTVGYVGDDEDVIDYLKDHGYDGVFDEDYEFVIVFDRSNMFLLAD